MTTGHGRGRLLLLVGALLLAAASCASDPSATLPSTAPTSTTAPSADAGARPPADALDLEPYYAARLASLGLRLTDRGGLIDVGGSGYRPSATGTHLALYVEPIGDRTAVQYIDGIRDVAAVFADVFDRWPSLESYDVCQEPVDNDGTQEPEPLPVTQIALTREQSAAIDWTSISIAEILRAGRADPPGLALSVGSELAQDPAYAAILREVDAAQP